MFGDFMGMMKTMKETKAKVEETKKRLDHVYLKETSGNGMITVSLNVNQHIERIAIDDAILQDKDRLEQQLVETLNQAFQKAKTMHDQEIAAVATAGLPDIPGLDLFK